MGIRGGRGLLLVALTGLLLAVPAAAAAPSGAASRGAVDAARKAALLLQLGALPPGGRLATAVAGLGLGASDRAAGRRELGTVDADGQGVLAVLPEATPDVVTVLQPLGTDDQAALAAGRRLSLDPEVYLRAIDQLLHSSGGRPLTPGPPDPARVNADLHDVLARGVPPLPAAPAAGPGRPTAQAAAPPPPALAAPSDGGIPWGPLGAGLLVVLAGAGALLLVHRRRPAPAPPRAPAVAAPSRDVADLLDVSRRLTSAATSGQIERAILREAVGLVPAQGSALVLQSEAGLSVGDQQPADLLVPERLGDGALRRVADTGQPLVQSSAAEPGIRHLPVALAAVPLVGGGRVGAVLLLVRSSAQPFTAAEQARLMGLAPLAAAALQSGHTARAAVAASLRDPLTGVANRRYFDVLLADALAAGAASLAIVDLDHFKRVNDTFGHPVGDGLLRSVVAVLQGACRPGDVVCRIGGEEFAVVMPGLADPAEAAAVGGRLCAAVAGTRHLAGAPEPLSVTASVGVAVATSAEAAELVHRADAALYEAKHGGRNRCAVAP